MSKPDIGFIGLGLMGAAMVANLQERGYRLHVMANRRREAVDEAVARGASEHGTAREIAAAAEIVMLCMDTSASVESRMDGEDGVIAGLSAGKTVIDFGTSLPGSTRALGERVAERGAAYLDAPLGRTPDFGRKGLLNIMAAGEEAAFERVRPVLEEQGENVFHLGALGSGHTIKLINNFVSMTMASAVAEAFAMCEHAGVGRQALYDVMSAGPVHSGIMDAVKAQAIDGDSSKLAFAIRNARKDVGYYARMADDLGKPSLLSPGTKQALGLAVADGRGDDLVAEMVGYFETLFEDRPG